MLPGSGGRPKQRYGESRSIRPGIGGILQRRPQRIGGGLSAFPMPYRVLLPRAKVAPLTLRVERFSSCWREAARAADLRLARARARERPRDSAAPDRAPTSLA